MRINQVVLSLSGGHVSHLSEIAEELSIQKGLTEVGYDTLKRELSFHFDPQTADLHEVSRLVQIAGFEISSSYESA